MSASTSTLGSGQAEDSGASGVSVGGLGGVGARIAVGAQLLLALAVIHFYELESEAFAAVFAVAVAGWLIQHAVPVPRRLAWLLVVAAGAALAALGLSDGLWVLATAAALIGLCLLPSRRWRLLAVLAAGVVLALARSGVVGDPWGPEAWPILASLFLFRIITFLYDRYHEREAPRPGLVAAYFLLPPNFCFPLFPVVDFGALRRSYEPSAGAEVHQEGVARIVRGLIQIFFYRLVYHLAVVPIEEVTDATSGVRFLVTNVLLIVRIMGMFHVSIGLLHLFGFRLPPTTHLPFFAPGFSEFWRRANVYWRDFVVKVFFYPAYFQLKGHGRLVGMAAATLLTFCAAWFLHSYQWFWFQGEFPLRWQDGAYWSLFGVLVTANALYAATHPKRRRGDRWAGPLAELARAGRIAGTFSVFCLLWSIWMTPSWSAWVDMWGAMASDGWAALVPVLSVLSALALLGTLWPDPSPASKGYLAGRSGWIRWGSPWQHPAPAALALTGLLALVAPGLAAGVAEPVERVVVAMGNTQPNAYDEERRTEGYYQDLAEIPRLEAPRWRREAGKPEGWGRWRPSGLAQETGDARMYSFVPSGSWTFKRKLLTTNSHGMRDQEYTLEKPPGVIRIAVLGASPAAGSGVADDETFEARVEKRLAEEYGDSAPRVEILNFAAPGFRIVRHLAVLRHFALDFDPDWVVLAIGNHTWRRPEKELSSALRDGAPIEPPELAAVAERCRDQIGRDSGSDAKDAVTRCLGRFDDEVIDIVSRHMAALSRERGFRLAWLEIPTLTHAKSRDEDAHRARLERLGFVYWDASDAYGERTREQLEVAPWDAHPNAEAHRLIAERWYPQLTEALGIAGSGPAGSHARSEPAGGSASGELSGVGQGPPGG